MKKLAAALVCALTASAWAQTYVSPHLRKDGTYVQGHVRSTPNRTVDDNYGTRGNLNPYTGQTGTQPRSYEQPYQAPASRSMYQQCGYTASGNYVCR